MNDNENANNDVFAAVKTTTEPQHFLPNYNIILTMLKSNSNVLKFVFAHCFF